MKTLARRSGVCGLCLHLGAVRSNAVANCGSVGGGRKRVDINLSTQITYFTRWKSLKTHIYIHIYIRKAAMQSEARGHGESVQTGGTFPFYPFARQVGWLRGLLEMLLLSNSVCMCMCVCVLSGVGLYNRSVIATFL